MAALIFQRGGEPFQPMRRALAPLVQDEPQVVSITNKVLDAVVLILDSARLRENAPGLQ